MKHKGINARAWFYSTSFHNHQDVEPSPELKALAEARVRAKGQISMSETHVPCPVCGSPLVGGPPVNDFIDWCENGHVFEIATADPTESEPA